MIRRDGYPAGVPCWVDCSQPDPAAAVKFYGGLFGWEFEDVLPPESPARYFIGRLHGGDVAAIGSLPPGAPPQPAWNTYVWVDSADEAAARVWAAGGRVLTEPFDVMDSGRMAVVADPAGAVFSIWQAKRHRGAEIVNEPGTLNFNTLSTPDPDGAKAFYGAVFGWQVLALGGGAEMWTLPGYADELERLDPGLRERMRASDAPAGFENVVAALVSTASDGGPTPPHWGVTFAVDDADAIAARAGELGGRVIQEPFDAPWVRMTVIADPQGAVFVASRYAPENRDLARPVGAASAQS